MIPTMQNSRFKITIASAMIALFILGLGYLVYSMIYAPSPSIEDPAFYSSSTSFGSMSTSTAGAFGSSTATSTPNSASSTEITYTNATANNIVVELPFPNAVVGKSFSVIGKARGTWFFEATFPIVVLDKNGKQLASGIGQAQTDWMTEDFVKFKANIKVPQSYIGPATLILSKDNPSGLPQYDSSIKFPITIEY